MEPTIVSALVGTIAGFVTALITTLITVNVKIKSEREKRSFETLYVEYKSYLHLIEQSNTVVAKSFKDYMDKVTAMFSEIRSGEIDGVALLNEYFRNYMNEFVSYISKIESGFASVRLVCSKEVLKSHGIFICEMKKMFEKISALPRGSELEPENAEAVEKELDTTAKYIEKVSKELIKNMRADIQKFLGNG